MISPTSGLGASVLPPISNFSMYVETNGGNSGNTVVFVSFERKDSIQISNMMLFILDSQV